MKQKVHHRHHHDGIILFWSKSGCLACTDSFVFLSAGMRFINALLLRGHTITAIQSEIQLAAFPPAFIYFVVAY